MISNWKKNPLETNKNEYCTIYTLLFDVDVILNDLEIWNFPKGFAVAWSELLASIECIHNKSNA